MGNVGTQNGVQRFFRWEDCIRNWELIDDDLKKQIYNNWNWWQKLWHKW